VSTTKTHTTEPIAIVAALNHCIVTCIDGEKGYATAAADVRNLALKSLFQRRAKERAAFAVALEEAIQKLTTVPESERSPTSAVHSDWRDIRPRGTEGRTDRIIVEEWARAERCAMKGYQRAIQRAPLATLPPEIRTLIHTQYAAIRAAVAEAVCQLTVVH